VDAVFGSTVMIFGSRHGDGDAAGLFGGVISTLAARAPQQKA
jgi:hypothetical protein